MNVPDVESKTRCAQCDGPLPAPVETLAVVHGADGTMLTTCSTACLAGLVAALVGRPSDAHRYAESRRN
jgi:hypothetical protein